MSKESGASASLDTAFVIRRSASFAASVRGGMRSMGSAPFEGASPAGPPGTLASAAARTFAPSAVLERRRGGRRVAGEQLIPSTLQSGTRPLKVPSNRADGAQEQEREETGDDDQGEEPKEPRPAAMVARCLRLHGGA